jgi:hypothetical protein
MFRIRFDMLAGLPIIPAKAGTWGEEVSTGLAESRLSPG